MNTPTTQFIPVSLPRRMAAILYDLMLVAGLLVLASAVATIPYGLIMGADAASGLGDEPLFLVWLLSVPALFFIGFWIWRGQTLGMRVWRIRLIGYEQEAISLKQAGIRFIAAILSWLPLGLGFLWSLQDPESRTWHDRLSSSRLVMTLKH